MNMDPLPNAAVQIRRPAVARQFNPLGLMAHATRLMLLAGLLLAATGGLQATTVIDTFNDMNATNAQTLASVTAAGGIGFSTGFEQGGTSVVVARTNDLSVSLVNYKSGQTNTAKHWSVGGTTASSGTARRAQSRSTPALGGTIWFSFLASLQNANGDVALVFNPVLNGSGLNTGNGLRVGVGHPRFPGALGVGPSFAGVDNTGLDKITNGVNGAITPNNLAPTNAIAGLVLGRISMDANSGYPRIDVWYNPDVASETSLPTPTLTFVDSSYTLIPTSITRLGYQVVRSTGGTVNELIDCVKVSDEPTAFDIVYKNAPLPIPLVNVSATVPVGNESGPSNIVFSISTDRPVTSPLTVAYRLTGVATNGFDGVSGYVDADYTDPNFNVSTLSSSVIIPAGRTNATVTLTVIDDALPEGDESVVLTLQSSPSEYLLGTSTASATILENNDANVTVQYMFTRTYAPQVWDPHLTASSMNGAGVGGGFSGAYFVSPDAGISASGDSTADSEAGALANGDYMTFTLAPIAGYAMSLTNLQFQAIYGNYLNQVPTAASATVFLRSSVDHFAANLASWTLQPDNLIFPTTFTTQSLDFGPAFNNLIGSVEFRLYVYDDSNHNQVGVRVDNLYISGSTVAAPPGSQQVSLSTNVIHAAEPATAGQCTVMRTGDTTSALTVAYTVRGTASNGVDYVLLPGSVTIPAGQTTAPILVTPIDDNLPESTETVILTLDNGPGYGVLAPVSATVNLADDGDVGGLVAWFFNENNNVSSSLASVAAASYKAGSKVAALGATAGSGLGAFGGNGTSPSVGHGYGSSTYQSAPSTLYINGGFLSTNAAGALSDNDYVSFTIAPVPGNALTLTNFSSYVKMAPTDGQTMWAFLRSSVDNFTTDLTSIIIPGVSNAAVGSFMPFSVPLNIINNPGAVEFRVYVYASRISGGDIFRLDDVILQGSANPLPPGVQQVTATASHPNAAEPSTSGDFTLARFGDTANPLTVHYTLTGTASNGVDYAQLSGSATFAAGATNLIVPVTVIDDLRPEPTETVVLTLLSDPAYSLGWPLTATVNIADDGDNTPLFTLSATDTNAYERLPSLCGIFTLSRPLGNPNTAVTLNFTLGGNAVLGVDYLSSATNSLTFAPGITSQTITITPINNTLVDGNRTVTLTVQPDSGFLFDPPLSATVTIVDDETAAAPVLWSDNFDAGTSATWYTVADASDSGLSDYTVDYAFDYSSLGLPSAPHSSGTTVGLKLNANLNSAAAGVNLYPKGQTFSGNYALRFDLYLSMDPAAGADNEIVVFGMNQSGTATNWWSATNVLTGAGSTVSGEGIWAAIATRDPVPNVYHLYAATNTGVAPMLVASVGNQPDLFNSPPYATPGRPNNAYDSTNKTWAECELSQVSGVITLKVNNNVLLQYANTTPFTNGNVFIGYYDPYASLGSDNCFAVIDNVRVVSLPAVVVQPAIQKITVAGATVTIDFTGAATDQAAAFKLQSSGAVSGNFGDDNAAVMTGSNGSFRATTGVSGAAQFYRLRR